MVLMNFKEWGNVGGKVDDIEISIVWCKNGIIDDLPIRYNRERYKDPHDKRIKSSYE